MSLVLGACSSVNFEHPKTESYVIEDVSDSQLARVSTEWAREHDNLSGFYPLTDGLDALGARLRMIELAEHSIDAQYFLMKGDTAGEIFAGSLLQAADRGVRIRILLDDVFTTVKDGELALLHQHPNVEVRLFNPVSRRGFYYLNYAGNFKRANRRMHNKSFTADNSVSIIGGRNIADEYFQLKTDGEFLDFDIMAIGPVVPQISSQFDEFWNHVLAVPMDALNERFSEQDLQQARDEIEEERRLTQGSLYHRAVNTPHMLELVNGSGNVFPAESFLIKDDSNKAIAPDSEEGYLADDLEKLLQQANSSIVLITPYFIPQKIGMDFWRDILDKGIEVTVITNSLASTNHIPVHSAYSRYRVPMLLAGGEIYEARADATSTPIYDHDETPERLTLHTKLIIIDDDQLFVGSLNLDPRSININTEMGLVIQSEALAGGFLEELEEGVEQQAYRLTLDKSNKLIWSANIDNEEQTERKEPLSSTWRRFLAWCYKLLPEGQL